MPTNSLVSTHYLSRSCASIAHTYSPSRTAEHKSQCETFRPPLVIEKLIERFFADRYIMHLLSCYAISSLDLLQNMGNSWQNAINITCSTKPIDTGDPNESVRMAIRSLRAVPHADAPPSIQKKIENIHRTLRPAPVTGTLLPLIIFYFSIEGYEHPMGPTASQIVIQEWDMAYMARSPRITLSPPVFVHAVDLDVSKIQM